MNSLSFFFVTVEFCFFCRILHSNPPPSSHQTCICNTHSTVHTSNFNSTPIDHYFVSKLGLNTQMSLRVEEKQNAAIYARGRHGVFNPKLKKKSTE